MNYYAVIGLLAALILVIVNYDVLSRSSYSRKIPVLGIYRRLLYGIMAYYITDTLWGIFDALHIISLLFIDTVIYYVVMVVGLFLWAQYVVMYLAEDNVFSRFLSRAVRVFLVAVVAAVAINCFTPILFWFDENGVYQPCPARYVQLGFQVLLLLLSSLYAFSAISQAEGAIRKRYRTIGVFGLVMAVLLSVQLVYPLLPLYSIAYMLGTCLLHNFVVRDELDEYRQGIRESMQRAKEHERVSQVKSEFLSNMSHEIRTPLNAVLGMNEMILRESKDDNILIYAESIKTAGRTLLGIINDILDFSKIEAGKMEIIPGEYDLSSVLNDLVNMIQARADNKGLALELDFDQDTPKLLCGDEIRVKQVITNILTNAVKYTEKGTVTFSVGFERIEEKQESVFLKVSVKDTGIGIKPENMKKLFAKFERIEEQRNRSVEGTGLGMTITKRLLNMMGTSLQVESEYGRGSTFYFRLEQKVLKWEPLGDYMASCNKLLKNRLAYREKFTAPEALILAVDDNPMNLMVFKNLLKQTRVRIDTADSGKEALLLAQDKKYDLLFLDHMMPEKDGIEILHELRARKGGPNYETPAICLTANAISGAGEQYIEAGFDGYLTKPIDSGRLEDMLMAYLPKEKIKEAAAEADTEDAAAAELTENLAPLCGQDWIDRSLGIENSGSVKDYLPLLKLFYETLDSKLNEIEGYYAAENWKDYTITVHALKSSARIIGASLAVTSSLRSSAA